MYSFAQIHVFIYLEYITRTEIAGSCGNYILIFEKLPNSFLKQLYYFKFLPAMYEKCHFKKSLPSNGCEVVSCWGFD